MEEISDAGHSYAFSKVYNDPNFVHGYKNVLFKTGIEENEFISFCLHKIFKNENFHGKRLLDVGCGPTVHRVATASAYFSEIIVSDFSEFNREEVQKWLKNESSERNRDPLYQMQAFLEGYENIEKGINEIQSRIRAKVKKVLPCDVLKKEIISKDAGKFDVLLTSLCLVSACTTAEIYKSTVKKLGEYILPGGELVMVEALNCNYYCVEVTGKIYCLLINEELINEALNEAGFKKKHYFLMKSKDNLEASKLEGIVILSAIKN